MGILEIAWFIVKVALALGLIAFVVLLPFRLLGKLQDASAERREERQYEEWVKSLKNKYPNDPPMQYWEKIKSKDIRNWNEAAET